MNSYRNIFLYHYIMPYQPDFIPGHTINLPDVSLDLRPALFLGGEPVHHSRFSTMFRQDRGFAACTAHNIDGSSIIPQGTIPRRDRFRFDPGIPNNLQIDNDQGYRGEDNPWDRGHLVRRIALHWGDQAAAEMADGESFFWSNIAPQHEHLHDSPWGKIEDWMLERADSTDQQACIFTGPVFAPSDPEIINRPGEDPVRIPAGFWKIMVILTGGGLRAAAFLVWQRDFNSADPLPFDPITEQVRITTIEYLTGLNFADLHAIDPLRFGARTTSRAGRTIVETRTGFRRVAALTDASEIMLV